MKWKWHVAKYGDILRICALHLTHPKCTHTHTAVNTHTMNTHPEQWAAIYAAVVWWNQTIHNIRQDKDNSCAVISAIFACKLREAIISILTEGCSSQTLPEQSRCRERAACALISRRCGSTNDHRDSLKFIQEVARFVTSRFFGKKSHWGVWKDKVTKLATLRASLLLTSLSVWLQQHTHFQTYTHTYRNIWTTASQR